MSYELLVTAEISDAKEYTTYRKKMLPLLNQFGGGFRVDFVVSDVLTESLNQNINRVFVIYFPDKQHSEQFFNHPTYLEIKAMHFDASVTEISIVSAYQAVQS